MKRARTISLWVLAAALLASSSAYAFANAPEKGSMGVWGYVANADDAQLKVSDQLGAKSLIIELAEAPRDAWIVVHADDNGMPGERVGLQRIDKGTNRDVKVALEGVKTQNVIVAMHDDRGTPGEFDFDMEDKADSPDRPFFVGGSELAKAVAVREFGVKDNSGTAAIVVSDQAIANDTLVVDEAAAPTGAFIVVHLDDDGMPGERVGVAPIQAGTSESVKVALDPKIELTDKILVAVHADRGTANKFEFDMDDKVNSPDQPFFVDGSEVATAVSVK